jgi:hypothetical protein
LALERVWIAEIQAAKQFAYGLHPVHRTRDFKRVSKITIRTRPIEFKETIGQLVEGRHRLWPAQGITDRRVAPKAHGEAEGIRVGGKSVDSRFKAKWRREQSVVNEKQQKRGSA